MHVHVDSMINKMMLYYINKMKINYTATMLRHMLETMRGRVLLLLPIGILK